MFASVTWPSGYGPEDLDRSRGWVQRWLDAKVEYTVPAAPPELPDKQKQLPAPRKPRAKKPKAGQVIDGRAIREKCVRQYITMANLSRELGCSTSHLSNVLAGKYRPSSELAAKLQEFLKQPDPE